MDDTVPGLDESQLSERYDSLVARAESRDIGWEVALKDVPDDLSVKVFVLAGLLGSDPRAALFTDELPEEEE